MIHEYTNNSKYDGNTSTSDDVNCIEGTQYRGVGPLPGETNSIATAGRRYVAHAYDVSIYLKLAPSAYCLQMAAYTYLH